MSLCDRSALLELEKQGVLAVEGRRINELLLDDFRIALTLAGLLVATGPIDLQRADEAPWTAVDPAGRTFNPHDFVLGITEEKITLGHGLFGTLHTRSKYARLGLEMLGSSNYVAPGSGIPVPIPLVLEIRFGVPVEGLELGMAYCFMLVHRAGRKAQTVARDYHERFPFAAAARPKVQDPARQG
jgi:hypothetical protein